MQVLVIGQHGLRLTPEAVDVPDPQQSQQNGGILLQGRVSEVLVLKREQGAKQLSGSGGGKRKEGAKEEEGGGRREGERHWTNTHLWPLSTHHPVSPGEQLLEVVKTCNTKAASTEMATPWVLLAVGTASSGTGKGWMSCQKKQDPGELEISE